MGNDRLKVDVSNYSSSIQKKVYNLMLILERKLQITHGWFMGTFPDYLLCQKQYPILCQLNNSLMLLEWYILYRYGINNKGREGL